MDSHAIPSPINSTEPVPLYSQPSSLMAPSKKISMFTILSVFIISTLLLLFATLLYLVWGQRLIFTPIDPNTSQLKSAGVSYSFEAKITEISKIDQGTIIKTDSLISNLPQLLISPRSIVQKKVNGKYNQVDVSELRAGQPISVNLYYHLGQRVWFTTIVYIL